MFRRTLFLGLCAILVVTASGLPGFRPVVALAGGISYASQPDELGLYLNDVVFVRDTVILPPGTAYVALPPGTYPDTLILTENGSRVREYRVAPQAADVYYGQVAYGGMSTAYSGGRSAYVVTWDSPAAVSAEATREVKLEYLLSGAFWTPTYDMTILSDERVQLAFFARIENTGLVLDEATVYLLAGRVDLSQQLDQTAQMTFNQYAVGYAQTPVALPVLGAGTVDLQHVYPLGQVSARPGETLFVNLVDETLDARRLHVWNAAAAQEVDVIYKVSNSTETPLAEGIVRVYQEGLFMGSDFIETTPPGGEGSVTVGRLPDVRVRRGATETYQVEAGNDYTLHDVTLEVQNFGGQDLALTILDAWNKDAWQFEYSVTPERQANNLLRWEVSVPAGESLTITYQYRTEY